MWKPGTLLFAQSRRAAAVLERLRVGSTPDYEAEFRQRFALVLGVAQTGYGTKGYKWDALLLFDGVIHTLRNCQIVDDRFIVYES